MGRESSSDKRNQWGKKIFGTVVLIWLWKGQLGSRLQKFFGVSIFAMQYVAASGGRQGVAEAGKKRGSPVMR